MVISVNKIHLMLFTFNGFHSHPHLHGRDQEILGQIIVGGDILFPNVWWEQRLWGEQTL